MLATYNTKRKHTEKALNFPSTTHNLFPFPSSVPRIQLGSELHQRIDAAMADAGVALDELLAPVADGVVIRRLRLGDTQAAHDLLDFAYQAQARVGLHDGVVLGPGDEDVWGIGVCGALEVGPAGFFDVVSV